MVNRKIAKVSSFRYTILALIFILLAGGLVLLPKYKKHEGIKPELLLNKVISPERYISTDEIASAIINQDPSYLLIDVRDSIEYEKYSIPNAINIPLEKILDPESDLYLNQDAYNVVFFSNEDFYANEAWIICTRLKYKNLRVMKGGINQWFNTIINPQVPDESSENLAFELYNTRKAASMYFGVAYPEQAKRNTTEEVKTPKIVVPVKKKKKMPTEGGC